MLRLLCTFSQILRPVRSIKGAIVPNSIWYAPRNPLSFFKYGQVSIKEFIHHDIYGPTIKSIKYKGEIPDNNESNTYYY